MWSHGPCHTSVHHVAPLFFPVRNICTLIPASTVQRAFGSHCSNIESSSRVPRSPQRNNEDGKCCLIVATTRSRPRPKSLRSKRSNARKRFQSRKWRKQLALTTLHQTGKLSPHGRLHFALRTLQRPTAHLPRLPQRLSMARHRQVAVGRLERSCQRVTRRRIVTMSLLS